MKKNYSSILTSTNVVTSAVNKAISKAQTGITIAASPLKTSKTAVKQIASVRPTTAPATYSTGRNVVDAQSIRKTLNDTRLLNEQKQREAQAVQQLPNDFPIENWEKMPVKAQLFAVQHSGLSKEDQWTVLNLMNPIKELVNVAPPKPAAATQNWMAPINGSAKTVPPKTTVTTSSASSGKEPVPFSGQDADTQRAEQRASRQATDAYNQLNETLESKNVDTSNLSGTGKDIYKNTRIAMANEVVQGTFDSSKRNKMVNDAAAAIAASKTAPTSVQDWKERVSQADTASKQLMDTLESVHVDTDNLTKEQQEVIANAERRLRDDIISGTVTQDQTSDKIRELCNQVTSELTPPKGGAYVTLMDTGYKQQPVRQMMPALGTLGSSGFDADALAAVKENSDDPYQRAVYNQAIADYNLAIKNGYVAIGNFNIFYNAAMKKAYEYSARKFNFEYTNEKGEKATGTVAMKDLVDPEDDSFGAKIARAALELYGKKRGEEVYMINDEGESFKMKLDCSKLVYYAINKYYPSFARYILGKGARYQMINTGEKLNSENIVWQKTEDESMPDENQLLPGDLLYWVNSVGKVVHTAIYLESGLMAEVWDNTRIVELREFTDYGDGSGSTLVQVNRLPEME